MTTNNETTASEEEPAGAGSTILRTLLTLIILAAASAIAYHFISNPKLSKKKETTEKSVTYVETQIFKPGDHPVIIEALGRVVPARQTTLRSRVGGAVTHVEDAFIPGGYFAGDATVIKIDPADYALNIKLKKAALAQARAALTLEQGQQEVARNELSILERTTGKKLVENDLALRKPQLEQARANVASAKAQLDIAELDLSRTTIKAPYNGIITARNVNLGQVISTTDVLATFVGTDEYWVEAEIPSHALKWLNFSSKLSLGAEAQIYQPSGTGIRHGVVKNMTGTLDENSRLAKVIVRVEDPLLHHGTKSKDAFPLNLNDYVRVGITAQILKNAYKIPQELVRDGNRLWVYDTGVLKTIKPEFVFEDRFYAYAIGGIDAQTEIISSDIITPVEGMALSHSNKDKVK